MTKFVNGKYLIRTQHLTRITIVSCCIILSLGLISLCVFYQDVSAMFYLSLIASIIVGIGSALGEGTNLGFLKTFPGNGISYYGSGTGFAGITGSTIFIALKPLGISDGGIYLIALPSAIPYYLCFRWLSSQKKLYPYIPQEEIEEKQLNRASIAEPGEDETTNENNALVPVRGLDGDTSDNTSNNVSDIARQTSDHLEKEGVTDNLSFSWPVFVNIMSKVGLTMSNLSIVYFLEYTITTSFTIANAQ